MNTAFLIRSACTVTAAVSMVFGLSASAQSEQHGRKYKPLAPTAHIVVTVEKGYNSKPLMNAAVIFHAVDKYGKNDGNLEVKTDPDGRAVIDVIEIGTHVTVQVIASGFATAASEMDVDSENKELLIKMQRPRAQVSTYVDNDGKPSQMKPGTQEHVAPPRTAPAGAGATAPATTPATTPTTPPATTGTGK